MHITYTRQKQFCLTLIFCALFSGRLIGQTDADALMMSKNNFCTGVMYSTSGWTNYWEGTFKRDNQNLGKVSTKALSVMGNYGISGKLNFLFMVPYVETKASAGTMRGMKGLQDLSLWLKWMPVETEIGNSTFSLYGIGGFSMPLTNYTADYLPLSIGLQSKTFIARLMADYQVNSFFATVSGSYIHRRNISIDRTAYYTNNIHFTNEVSMPDVMSYQLRTGYRTGRLIAEGLLTQSTTLGGTDIRKNDMPFPSNKMNATSVGVNIKYEIEKLDGLSLIGGGNYVMAGRNVGQATMINAGIFYLMDFSKKQKPSTP